jgi:hypothetical protein
MMADYASTEDKAIKLDTIVVASRNQLSSDLSGEVVILSLADGTYYGLGRTGSRIWSLLQEPRRVEEIVEILVDEYDVELDRCRAESLAMLDDLHAHALIEIYSDPS